MLFNVLLFFLPLVDITFFKYIYYRFSNPLPFFFFYRESVHSFPLILDSCDGRAEGRTGNKTNKTLRSEENKEYGGWRGERKRRPEAERSFLLYILFLCCCSKGSLVCLVFSSWAATKSVVIDFFLNWRLFNLFILLQF